MTRRSSDRCRGAGQTRARKTQTGHTLVELLLSMVTATILLVGLFGTLFVASQAISPSMASNAIVPAATVASDILHELQLAISFTERTATAVTFAIADRDSDSNPETIRYAWSAGGGAVLTRQYNGGTERDVLANVQHFHLEYDVLTVDQAEPPPAVRYFVRAVTLELQPVDAVASRIRGATEVRDRPEVASP